MRVKVLDVVSLERLNPQSDTFLAASEHHWHDIRDSDIVPYRPGVRLSSKPARAVESGPLNRTDLNRELEASIKRFISEQGFTSEVGKKLLANIRPFFIAAQNSLLASHAAVANQSFEKPAALKNQKRGRKVQINVETVDLEQIRAARRLVVAYQRRKRTGQINLKPRDLERIKAAESLVNAYNRARRTTPSLSP